MTKARPATATVTFVDEYAELYQDLFPDVRSFEAFKYLLMGMLSELKRKTLPAIAKAVGADAQALHHVLAYAPWSVQEVRTRRLTLLRQALDGRPFVLCIDETGDRKKGKTTDYVALCWLLRLSVPKMSLPHGSPFPFTSSDTDQSGGEKVSHTPLIPEFLEQISKVASTGARLLTGRLELTSALPLTEEYESTEVLARAAGVAAAAGSPWGGIFRTTASVPATHGSFDGKVATATAEGVRYTLGPVEDWSSLPEATRLHQRGDYVLVLRSEREQRPLGMLAVRPQLAVGIQELVQTCHHYGVELAVISTGHQLAVEALAHRASVPLLESNDPVVAIRAMQRKGAYVVFVSDNAGAAAGFAACDLAIGLTDDRSYLPARADLLAPDLSAVAAVIEAASQREATVRDSVALSLVSNIVGAILGFRGVAGLEEASRVVHITALAALADGWLRLRGGKRPGSALAHLVDPRGTSIGCSG